MQEELKSEFARLFPQLAQELGPANTQRFLEACSVVDIPQGRKLFRDRMPVDSLYLVLDGEMAVSIGDGKKKIELGRVGPRDLLGEVAVLSGEMRASSTVTTDTPCRALRIHARDFENFVLHDEEIAYPLLEQLIALLTRRLRDSAATEQAAAEADA